MRKSHTHHRSVEMGETGDLSIVSSLMNVLGLGDKPLWSQQAFTILLVLFVLSQLLSNVFFTGSKQNKKSQKESKGKSKEGELEIAQELRWKYIVVYLIIMYADWLQGVNMYSLYQSYNVDVGTLFTTGFASSCLFGTFIGSFADQYGRKKACIFYCILEVMINFMEHIPNFHVLLVGRVLGGISTSLLFTTFDAWIVGQHKKHNISEEHLERTFSLCSTGNGIVAVLAAVSGQYMADAFENIGPFQLAIGATIVAMLLIFRWEENYGADFKDKGANTNQDAKETEGGGGLALLREGVRVMWCNPNVFWLGMALATYEGAMYTFVFMWVPVLQELVGRGKSNLPLGLVMACFMMCLSMGGSLSSLLLRVSSPFSVLKALTVVAACCMLVPVVMPENFTGVFLSFLALEVCVGTFNPLSSILRGEVIPSHVSSTVANFFRVPLNIFVVIGTKLSDASQPLAFKMCVACYICALLMAQIASSSSKLTSKHAVKYSHEKTN